MDITASTTDPNLTTESEGETAPDDQINVPLVDPNDHSIDDEPGDSEC